MKLADAQALGQLLDLPLPGFPLGVILTSPGARQLVGSLAGSERRSS